MVCLSSFWQPMVEIRRPLEGRSKVHTERCSSVMWGWQAECFQCLSIATVGVDSPPCLALHRLKLV